MKKKVFALIAAVAAVLIAVLVLGLSRCVGDYGQIVISLSQKDATVDVADSFQLQLVSDEGVNVDDLQVTWISNKSFIASVNENGTVFGVGAGEAKISAIVQYKDKEYIASCRVTVTPTQEEPSVYRIRYYTQKRDRSGYDIVEDVYESAVGMQINLTDTDISHKLPENYVVNKEKSILSHTVTENKSACVLEVYYDVAKISYTVEAHYESPKKLETYGSTVKQEIEAYAFSPVTLPAPREGFVLNEKAKGSILQDDSIVAGEKLVAYYDRIRSEVKVTFINKPQATYKAVYGIGLVNGKFSDLTDSTELFNVTAYVDNQQVKLTEDYLRKLTADTHISFGVDGQGFYYVADGGVLVNCNYEKTKDSYVYLKGSGSTVYLSATADLTGSGSNIFGITIRSGDQTREVRFQDHGVSVMENHTAEVGTVSGDRDQYTRANWHEDANVYAQNAAGAHYNTYRSSAVNSMVTQRTESSHQIVWTIWEGTLYCSVDGHISLRLPLYHLDPNWTADKTYEIGFSAYDYWYVGDELRFRDICVKFDAEAEKMLVLNNQVKAADFEDMHYQPITGTYLPTIDYGSSYLYLPAITGNGGIRADISWVNKDNSYASPGVTVKVGDVSHYFMVEGMNFWARHFTAVKESIVKMTDTYGHVVRYSKPFDDAGMCKLQAFVKDGKLHILYNGAQAYCIEMKDLFEGYTNKSKVSFGIYCLDGLGGLAHFANVKPVTGQDVQGIDLKDWAFYSENYYTDDLDMAQGKMSQTAQMSEGRFVEVYGEAATWQVEALMKRTDTAYDQDLPMGLRIQAGDKTATVFGGYNGFAVNEKWNEISQGGNLYAFNNKTTASFFAVPRTTDQISFKAVIHKDVLYVWLDGQPCWRLPLTEEYFGGFAAGSKYKIGLAFAGWQGAGETGTMENIQIKSGSQVTEQNGFADTLATLNANIDRWNELHLGHIYGKDAESFSVNSATWDNAYGYFAPAKGDMGLKVTTGWTDPAAGNTWSRVGITLKVGDISHQFVLEEEHSEVKHFTSFNTQENITDAVKRYVDPFKADRSCDMMALIRDGKLYLYYNGVQGYMVSMGQLFPGYTADSDVSLGICNLDSQTGIGTFKNIEVLSAAEVALQAASGHEVANMNRDPLTGAYLPVTQNGPAYLYNEPIVGNQAISATIRYYNGEISSNGITIKIGDQSVQLVGHGGYDYMRIWRDQGQSQINEFPHPMTVNNIYSQIHAVIRDGKLYMVYNGQQMNPINLTELFPGYQATDAVALGIYSHDAPADWIKFTDVQFLSGADMDKLVSFYAANVNSADVNILEGTILKKGYAQVQLEGASDVWEITGTLNNQADGKELQAAFEVRDANGRAVQAMLQGNGIQFPWGDYRENGPYCINHTGHFYWWGIKEMDFRIVVANDIMYAWFESAGDGKLIASWRIPLGEYYNGTAYGGCAAGSQYTFKLLLGGDDATNGQSSFSNLVIKTGDDASTEGIW